MTRGIVLAVLGIIVAESELYPWSHSVRRNKLAESTIASKAFRSGSSPVLRDCGFLGRPHFDMGNVG